MRISSVEFNTSAQLSFVNTITLDGERKGSPVDAVPLADFSNGLSTWNLDAVNATELGAGRIVAQDATAVYIGNFRLPAHLQSTI